MDAAARMCRRGREVEPADSCLGSPEPGRRTEDQLLVKLRGAAVECAVHEVGVPRLEPRGREYVPPAHECAEAGRERLDALLDQVREGVRIKRVPAVRQVRVGPRRVLAGAVDK